MLAISQHRARSVKLVDAGWRERVPRDDCGGLYDARVRPQERRGRFDTCKHCTTATVRVKAVFVKEPATLQNTVRGLPLTEGVSTVKRTLARRAMPRRAASLN